MGAPVHPAQDRFVWVALAVMDEDAAVEEFSPVFFFRGVGDGCAEGFPDEWPWDGDVGKADRRCSVGSVEAHAFSQLGRVFWLCGSV